MIPHSWPTSGEQVHRGDVEIQGVGDPIDEAEGEPDLRQVPDRPIADSNLAKSVHVPRRDGSRACREGSQEVKRGSELGELTMLKLPGDEFVTIELVDDSRTDASATRGGPSHFVIQVESIDATIRELSPHGIDVEAPTSPDGSTDFLTTWIVDPDGNRIELVQWPTGHRDGMSSADFKGSDHT